LIKINSIRPILIDGQINIEEWEDAHAIVIDSFNMFYIKEDAYYYYLSIKSKLPKPLYIDMFVKTGDTLFNIHASSQLGDRILKDTLWTDILPPTLWGQNKSWIANNVKFDRNKIAKLRSENFQGSISASAFIPYDGFEFQFKKKHWDLKPSKLRIEIRNMIGPEGFIDVVFPSNSIRMNSNDWYRLQ